MASSPEFDTVVNLRPFPEGGAVSAHRPAEPGDRETIERLLEQAQILGDRIARLEDQALRVASAGRKDLARIAQARKLKVLQRLNSVTRLIAEVEAESGSLNEGRTCAALARNARALQERTCLDAPSSDRKTDQMR